MTEEFDSHTEHVQEAINERAEDSHEHHATGWVGRAALSAAILAVLAAICALYAGHHSNEAILDQIKASDQWAYYQSKSIKASLLESKMALLEAAGSGTKEPSPKDQAKLKQYEDEKEQIQEKAKEHEADSKSHFHDHKAFSHGVTLFQVAIAVVAIAVLTRKKTFWLAGLALGACGIAAVAYGLLSPI